MTDIKQYEPLWGVWRIEEAIGAGSFGKVYRAVREEFGQKFYSAIKHISIPANDSQVKDIIAEGLATDAASAKVYFDDVTQKLLSEIILMYELRGTTNIVSYEDHIVIPKSNGIGNDIFIRMELLTSLNTLMSERQFSASDVTKLGIDMCCALEACSKNNIVHRDIKPSNIFVNERGDYKLGDFGVAKQLKDSTTFMSVKGTYNYMSPEIYHSLPANLTADIYSLGIVMYRLLNGNRAPLLSADAKNITSDDNMAAFHRRMTGEPLPPPAYADSNLSNIILIATNYDRTKRFPSPTEFKNALQSIANGQPYVFSDPDATTPVNSIMPQNTGVITNQTVAAAANAPVPATNQTKKKPIGIIAAILVLLLIGGGVLAYLFPTDFSDKKDDLAATVDSSAAIGEDDESPETDSGSESGNESSSISSESASFSSWSSSLPSNVSSDNYIIETKKQYRYRDKQTTTSENSSMSGWTLESKTSAGYSEWGSWSAWTKTAIDETDTRDVETYTVEPTYKTRYKYTGYKATKPDGSSWFHYCKTCGQAQYPSYSSWTSISVTLDSKLSSVGTWSCGHRGSGNKYKTGGRYYYNVSEVKEVVAEGYTQYRYRTRTEKFTYKFYKWGSWSNYSDKKYTSSSTREVETKTLYRYKLK